MHIEIISNPFVRVLHGVAGDVENGQYGQAGTRLMDEMWRIIGKYDLQHKGINHWVYQSKASLFVGVELENAPDPAMPLQRLQVNLPHYAYGKHIGAVSGLGDVYEAMYQYVKGQGLQAKFPNVEIYGHWTGDEATFETEVLISLE